MSRTSEVLKNRKKIERELRARKNEEISKLRKNSSFRASASELFKEINVLLADDSVKSIVIEVDSNSIPNFGSMLIESHELDMYDIKQEEGKPGRFRVGKRYISI